MRQSLIEFPDTPCLSNQSKDEEKYVHVSTLYKDKVHHGSGFLAALIFEPFKKNLKLIFLLVDPPAELIRYLKGSNTCNPQKIKTCQSTPLQYFFLSD